MLVLESWIYFFSVESATNQKPACDLFFTEVLTLNLRYKHLSSWRTWLMQTRSKIRVYNFSWTKSLLWPTQGQREDADCWYFCLFKLFTHSETTLILVCGMLVVGDCRAVWRTDGPSKNLFKNTRPVVTVQLLFSSWWWRTPLLRRGRARPRRGGRYLLWAFVWFSVRSVQCDNHRREPCSLSNQPALEKKREPHSQPLRTHGSLFPLVS